MLIVTYKRIPMSNMNTCQVLTNYFVEGIDFKLNLSDQMFYLCRVSRFDTIIEIK